MKEKKLLTEENYQNTKNKISKIAMIVLIAGLLLGGILILIGVNKKIEIDNEYSEKNYQEKINIAKQEIENIKEQINVKSADLEKTKKQLETQIEPTLNEIKKLEREPFTGFNSAYYEREDKIEELQKEIAPIKKQISEIQSYQNMGFCLNPTLTKEVCDLEDEITELEINLMRLESTDFDFEKSFNSSKYIPFFMFGAFIIITTLMISGSIYMVTKRREIAAFSTQQIMPIAKEGLEEMAPAVAKAGSAMIKEIVPTMSEVGSKMAKEMAPAYKEVVKEITKGIKEGLKEEETKETTKENKKETKKESKK